MALLEKSKQDFFASYVDNIKSLDQLLREPLEKYYVGTNVTQSPRFTKFFEWLKKNDQQLLKDLKEDIRTKKVDLKYADSKKTAHVWLGVWLGVRYIASIYKKSEKQDFPKLNDNNFPGMVFGLGWSKEHNSIFESSRNFEKYEKVGDIQTFLSGFNGGVHEGTHALGLINGSDNSLSELATFINLGTYALPFNLKDAKQMESLSEGLRNAAHNLRQFKGKEFEFIKEYATTEYLIYLIGPWIKNYFKQDQLFSFEEKRGRELFQSTHGIMDLFTSNQLFGGVNLDKFFKEVGIINDLLKIRLKSAFDKMKKIGWSDGKEFLEVFQKVMTEEFGKPDTGDIPDGFVLNTKQEEVNSALAAFSNKKLKTVPTKLA
ncbi:MAG: hypothetical protein AABX38_03065 [Candidatus Micrarchaeota archaeon]